MPTVVRATAADDQVFLFETVEHARHRTAVYRQVATQLGRGVDAVLGDDDQHLELRSGNAVGLHVAVDDAVFDQRGAAQKHAEGAVLEVFRGVMLHGRRYLLRQ
ncbi:hypothetical protein D3C76_1589300 [compost metagenome]